MADADLERRVRILEEKMDELQEVPRRRTTLELQIVQLRGEVHSGFSALQTQIDDVRAEMVRLNDETRTHMRVLHEEVISRLTLLSEEPASPRAARTRRGPKRR